jgi:hypothetical protein
MDHRHETPGHGKARDRRKTWRLPACNIVNSVCCFVTASFRGAIFLD